MRIIRVVGVVGVCVGIWQAVAVAQSGVGKVIPPPDLGLLLITDKISTSPVTGSDWVCRATNVGDVDPVHMVINVYVDVLFKPGGGPTKTIDCNEFAVDPGGTLPHQTCDLPGTTLTGTGFLFSTAHCEVKILSGNAMNVRAAIVGTGCGASGGTGCSERSDAR